MATNIQDTQLLEIIVDTLKEYSFQFVKNRRSDASSANLEATKELLQSFRTAVDVNNSGGQASLLLAFEEHGRFVDMKRRSNRWKKQPPVEKIEEWIRDKGSAQFLAGYKRNIGPGGSDRAIENIAWAIAKTIKKKGIKRRSWYSKNRERDIQKVFDLLIERYQEYLLKDQKKQLKNVSTQG